MIGKSALLPSADEHDCISKLRPVEMSIMKRRVTQKRAGYVLIHLF